jgi:hypothetical protein
MPDETCRPLSLYGVIWNFSTSNGFDIGADRLDDSEELVTHSPAGVIVRHGLVRPQVAAADRRARDANERVRGVDQPGVRDILDPHVAGAVHQCRPHGYNVATRVVSESRTGPEILADTRHRG